MPAPTVTELNEAKQDLDDLEQIVNGDSSTIVSTRIGGNKDSVSKAIADALSDYQYTVADYTTFATNLAASTYSVGDLVQVVSPAGPPFEIKQGVETDDGGVIITQNRGTTSASQFYGERPVKKDIFLSWYELPTGSDDTGLMANAFSRAATLGGANIVGSYGSVYSVTAIPAMTSFVTFDMAGSIINATLGSGNVYGLRIGPNKSGVKNGTINVISTGTPSSQFIFHAPISCGNPNGLGGTVSSPDDYAEVKNFFIKDMTLTSTRMHGPVIQVQGDSYNGYIKNIEIPDSSTCSGVHLDWSDISVEGTITSADIPLAKETFLAGDGYTTHPHDIVIENINCGDLSVTAAGDLGSRIVRLSACYNITANNLYAGRTTQQAIINVGGDLGFEFAPEVVKDFAHKNIGFSNIVCERCDLQGVFLDTFGDNIQGAVDNTSYLTLSSVSGTFVNSETITGGTSSATATISTVYSTNTDQLIITSVSGTFINSETITGGTSSATATISIGYSNLLDTIMEGSVSVTKASLRGSNSDVAVSDGVRIQDIKGAEIKEVSCTRFKNGCAIEADTENVQLTANKMFSNLEDGFNVLNSATIKDVDLRLNKAWNNGTKAGSFGGFNVDGGEGIVLDRNVAGATNESSQNFGFKVGAAATYTVATRNKVIEISQDSDIPFNWGSDSKAYGVLWECYGNEYYGSLALSEVAGVDMITVKSTRVIGDFVVRELWGNASSLSADTTPTTGTWVAGDKIYFTNPAAAGDIGTTCVTGGSPGTWKRFGPIDA